MQGLRTFLLHLFSERDNETPDVVRIVGGISAVVGIGEYFYLSWLDVAVNKQPFAHEAFGAGLSTVIGVLGVAIAVKAMTEKKP